ncbi:MAG: carbon-nitrogen hydrolase family protein [Myxococcota bacterium]
MRVAALQMCSSADVPANLAAAAQGVEEAARAGALFVGLPENFAYLRREGEPIPCAQPLDGEIVGSLRSWARAHGVWLLGGSFPESVPGEARVHNTSVLVAPDGTLAAVYRKIHLFDVDLRAQGGGCYQESAHVAPGADVVVADTPFGGVGLSVCYDLRFPELYRAQSAQGARFLTVPSAFARETGRDHWETLLRARAIENQCFVVAPAQWGDHNPERSSHGRTMIVDPWGVVLGVAPDRPALVLADCDVEQLERIRAGLPALRHRRL